MSSRPSTYIMEWLTRSLAVLYGIDEIIYSGKTKYQKVDIVRTRDYGLALILDGLLQSAEVDEHVYHESLVHPVMVAHPEPKRVLVVGGGEGATIREVERHRCVEEVTMVDLDGELIELVKEKLPMWSRGAFEDKRLRLLIEEGRSFLTEQPDGSYDVIVMDVTDPVEWGPALKLYTKEFYEVAEKKLASGGLLVTQASSASHSPKMFLSIAYTLGSVFPRTCLYSVYIKSFASLWGFAVGSKGPLPSELLPKDVEEKLEARGVKGLKFYSGEVHRALFALTDALMRTWGVEPELLTDSSPIPPSEKMFI